MYPSNALCESRDTIAIYCVSGHKGSVHNCQKACWFSTTGMWTCLTSVGEVANLNIVKSYSGKLHIGVNDWTSPNVFFFLGAVVYMVKDGKIHSHILDFIKYMSDIILLQLTLISNFGTRLSKGHTGQYLANQLSNCLEEFGISNNVCCHDISQRVSGSLHQHLCLLFRSFDNASNNDTMLAELETLMEGNHGVHTWIHCICHIFNLVVKVTFYNIQWLDYGNTNWNVLM